MIGPVAGVSPAGSRPDLESTLCMYSVSVLRRRDQKIGTNSPFRNFRFFGYGLKCIVWRVSQMVWRQDDMAFGAFEDAKKVIGLVARGAFHKEFCGMLYPGSLKSFGKMQFHLWSHSSSQIRLPADVGRND